MEVNEAVSSLAALAHAGRLAIFRSLVNAGPQGLPAGEVSRRLGVAPNTLSANLTVLRHAGLAASRREGRSIVYSARFDRMAELLAFLMQDCCGGAPEVCAPLAEAVDRAACRAE